MYVIAGLETTAKYENKNNVDLMSLTGWQYNIRVSDNRHKALCGSGIVGQKVLR